MLLKLADGNGILFRMFYLWRQWLTGHRTCSPIGVPSRTYKICNTRHVSRSRLRAKVLNPDPWLLYICWHQLSSGGFFIPDTMLMHYWSLGANIFLIVLSNNLIDKLFYIIFMVWPIIESALRLSRFIFRIISMACLI